MNKLHYWYSDDFKTGNIDESEYYNINENPTDATSVNIILLLSKYNFDITKSNLNLNDADELKRIVMEVYENTIDYFNGILQNFILTYVMYKYDRDLKYLIKFNEFRSIINKLLRRVTEYDSDEFRSFVYDVILDKDKLIQYYDDTLSTYNGMLDNVTKDIDVQELISLNLFSKEGFFYFLLKYSNSDEHEVKYIIEKFLSGGCFDEY